MKSLEIGFVNKNFAILQKGEGLRKEWKVLSKRSNYSFHYFNNTELYSRRLKPQTWGLKILQWFPESSGPAR